MNDMDLGIILGTTLWDDDLEDIYPREALLEAGLVAKPRKAKKPRPVRTSGSATGVGLFHAAPTWLHGEACRLAEDTGRTNGVLVTISSESGILWTKSFDRMALAIKGSLWASIRRSSADLHFWDIPSLLEPAVNTVRV